MVTCCLLQEIAPAFLACLFQRTPRVITITLKWIRFASCALPAGVESVSFFRVEHVNGLPHDHRRHSPAGVLVSRQSKVILGLIWLVQLGASGSRAAMENVRIADDHRGFVLTRSGSPFLPWGFNYDHDENSRLLEDYWDHEWPKVVADFQEMKELGANIVRVHLQFGKFMKRPDQPNADALERLANLIRLAEQTGLYLGLTGLGCYRKRDVPAWYDALAEPERWAAQARFWEAVAARCARSPALFCYDLMNEPVVPGGRRQPGEWLGPPLGEFHYVQVITLDQKERARSAIARAWIDTLARAIRAWIQSIWSRSAWLTGAWIGRD